MAARKYYVDANWHDRTYRGKNLSRASLDEVGLFTFSPVHGFGRFECIYAEHDDNYLKECLLNLKAKGAELVNGKTVDSWLVDLDLKGVK